MLIIGVAASANAQSINERMKFLGSFQSGQPGVNIYKFYDNVEDVLCYILMPEVVGRKILDDGKIIYDANTIGSISCMKVFIVPTKPTESKNVNIKK